jgi:photosystem II stability/assembly factor-like uncharacterized protein
MKNLLLLVLLAFSVTGFAQDWEPLNTNTTARIYDMSFPPGQNDIGYAATGTGLYSGEGTIIKTVDGGDTWSQIYPATGTQGLLKSVFFTSNDVGYAGGLNDLLIKTTDGGATWTDISPSTAGDIFHTIVFYDENHGIAVANPIAIAESTIYVTADAGASWVAATGLVQGVYDLAYSNQNTVIAVGKPVRRISKSTDGGLTWTLVDEGLPDKLLLGVDFAGDYGVAVGSNGDTYITNDAGDNWAKTVLGENGNYQGIHVFDNERTIIGGMEEKMYMTTDGGLTWELEYDGPNAEFFYDIEFTENGTGFAGLSSGVILRKAAPMNCEAVAAPYSEDFSNGDPACWEYENTDNTNPVWAYNDSVDITGDGSNDPLLVIIPPNAGATAKDDWAFSRKIQMDAGTGYSVSVDYNAFNLGNIVANENFELVITDAPNSTATFSEVLGTYNDILQQGTFPGQNDGNDIKTQAYTASENFTPTASGEYYVAIHALGASGADAGGFFVFSTSVEETSTDCSVAATVPYLEDYSNGDPACWAYENTDGIDPEWAYNDSVDIDGDGTNDPFYGLFPPAVQYKEKDDWAFSKKIQMDAGTQYYVSALYNAINLGNATAYESFELVVTDAQNSSATFKEVLGTYTDIAQQGVFPGQNNGNDIKSQAYRAEEAFTPNTSGEYYVAIHATGGTSNDAGGFALFETAVNLDPIIPTCTAATVPYTEDMDSGTPECWEYEDADNALPVWAYNDQTDITGDGNNDPILIMVPQNAGMSAKDDWAFTRKIELVAGTEYLIETDYNALNLGNGTASENFELVVTDAPSSSAGSQTIIGTYNDITQQGTFPGQNDGNDLKNQAYTASETFTPTTSGEYYVAVHALGNSAGVAGGFMLFNMNVSVNIIPSDGELILFPETSFTGVNANGSAASGYNLTQNIMWTETNGLSNIGGINPGNGTGGDVEMSNDGNKIVGPYVNPANSLKEMSIYDVPSQTWTVLGGIGGQSGDETGASWGISGDGETVVGLGWLPAGGAHAITWNEATGVVDLGSTVTNRSTRADAVSGDGSVVVGWQDSESGFRQAAIWTNGQQQLIEFPTGQKALAAGAISDDGVWIGGEGSSTNSFQAYRWSEATGLESLGPPLNPGWRGNVTGLSSDGSVIVGYYRPQGPALFGSGFIWTEALGVTDLNTYAESLGIDTQGIVMSLPLNISADGTTVVGAGRDANNQRVGFILKLQPTILGTEDHTETQDYTYYPNPVRDILHINSSTSFERVMLFNINGQLIIDEPVNSTNKELSLSGLSSGIYLVKVQSNNVVETFKIVKQ